MCVFIKSPIYFCLFTISFFSKQPDSWIEEARRRRSFQITCKLVKCSRASVEDYFKEPYIEMPVFILVLKLNALASITAFSTLWKSCALMHYVYLKYRMPKFEFPHRGRKIQASSGIWSHHLKDPLTPEFSPTSSPLNYLMISKIQRKILKES